MHLKKGPFPKERLVFQAAFFTGDQSPLTMMPRYSLLRLWPYVAPSLLMLLSCWMQRMVSLVHWLQLRFDEFSPPLPTLRCFVFSFPPWLMVTDLHLRITAEVNRAQTGLSCGCSSDQLSLGRKKRMETGDIWETTLGLGCWIFLLSIFCSVLSDSLKKTRVFFKLYFSAVYSLCELAVSNECVYVCRCEGMWKRCR